MSVINLKSLTKKFGDLIAVNAMDLELREGELVAFLGPSGCGKTTTLRMIAGFERPDSGEIWLGGREVSSLPPEKRDAGMVFQNYALFPHLTVVENVAFGLQMRKVSKTEIAARVKDILEKVQLSGMEHRYPRQLSGGQQQRTALARALVFNPKVLLLDEPLANLDAKLREEMRFYIRHLQQEFGITTVYVTHDQAEALVLADRVAVMKGGFLQQIDVPEEIYRRPANPWVADFVGIANLISGKVVESTGHAVSVETPVGQISGLSSEPLPNGSDVLINLRPESLRIVGTNTPELDSSTSMLGTNHLSGTVLERAYLGNLTDYRVQVAEGITLRVQAAPFPAYEVGSEIALQYDSEEAWVIRDSGDGVQ